MHTYIKLLSYYSIYNHYYSQYYNVPACICKTYYVYMYVDAYMYVDVYVCVFVYIYVPCARRLLHVLREDHIYNN